MPLSVVEGEGFCHMLEKLEPRFQPPSRKRITVNVLPRMYSELKDTTVVPSICSVEYCALTTECWTSHSNDSYIGLTVHVFTADWKFAHFVAENKELPVSHTAEHLAEVITETIHDWEITETKISCTTVDNGANVHKSLADVLQWPYLHCFGHTLNLAVKAGLPVSRISNIQAKCPRIVSFFRRSSKAKYTLIEEQKALGLPKHALLQDVCAQWNSTFEMMRCLLEQQAAVCAVVIELKCMDLLPSGDNFKIVENVIEVLKPFKDITETVSGEQYTTVSLFKPLLHHLLTQSLEIRTEDPVCIQHMKTAMKENLNVARSSVFLRSTNLESKLIKLVFVKY